MEVYKKGRLILLVLFIFTISSCAGGRGGSFRRIKGHKVWIPGKKGKLKRKYERCYNFSD
jgi:hypothetical protein